ncbi:hypothetical protein F4703DRAFT_1855011 [Phycomyces blakesleeanus]
MPLDLPIEIISIIATYLSTKDKITCSYICKQWSKPFQVASWNIINVNENVIRSIKEKQDKESIYSKNGRHGKQIILSRQQYIGDLCWDAIRREFPNTSSITVAYKNLNQWSLVKDADRGDLNFLKTINIQLSDYTISPPSRSFEIFSSLPYLTKLHIDVPFPRTHFINHNILEAIKTNLPLLKSISVKGSISDVSPYAMFVMERARPANNITSIEIRVLDFDKQWVCYLARKYPNIRRLVLGAHTSHLRKELHDITLNRISSIPNSFANLEELSVYNMNDTRDSQTFFWKMLSCFNMPIKRLSYKLWLPKSRQNCFTKVVFQACIDIAPKTIEELHIFYEVDHDGPPFIPLYFSVCPNLVNLFLSGRFSVNLDTLFDNCRSLRNATFYRVGVKVTQKGLKKITTHDMSAISLHRVETSPSILEYISQRNDGRPFYMHIIAFRKPAIQPKLTLEAHHNTTTTTTNNNNNNNNNNNDTDVLIPDGYKPKEDDEFTWFHDYLEFQGLDKAENKKRVLDEDESRYARDYYRNFQERRDAETPSQSESVRYFFTRQYAKQPLPHYPIPEVNFRRRTLEDEWKKDLHRGYAELRFKGVDQYEIGTSLMCTHKKYSRTTFVA